MPITSSLQTQATSIRKETVNISLDYSRRREISQFGQSLTGVPTVDVMLDDTVSTDFTVTNVQVDSTGTKVLFTLHNVAGLPETVYQLVITVGFTGGNVLVEGLDVEVESPSGGLLIGCGR